MRETIRATLGYLAANVGHCAVCMRKSLASAAAAWAVWAVAAGLNADGSLLLGIGAVAWGLSGLWVLHIAVYAGRSLVAVRSAGGGRLASRDGQAEATSPTADIADIGRRGAVAIVLRSAGIGLAASLPAFWAAPVYAFCGQCTRNADCGGSRNGWCCKNTAPVNAGYVCNECKKC